MEKKVIAVTGGIGSGKSTVCRLLEKKGFQVVDCDALSRRAAERSDTLEDIVRVFGERFVDGGKLNRRALALEVFSDSEKTDKLNKIFHKRIFGLLEEEIAKQNGTVFVEIQLLPDDKIRLFDGVWLVTASEETRIKRAMARDDRSEEPGEKHYSKAKRFLRQAARKRRNSCQRRRRRRAGKGCGKFA